MKTVNLKGCCADKSQRPYDPAAVLKSRELKHFYREKAAALSEENCQAHIKVITPNAVLSVKFLTDLIAAGRLKGNFAYLDWGFWKRPDSDIE